MITIPALVENISTRKDRTIKIVIGSNEVTPSVASDLFSLNNQICYVAIKPEPFRKEELNLVESLEATYDGNKTPSQRLRGVLYKLFTQDNEGFKSFTLYYDHHLERIIDHFKTKITQ